MKEPDLSGRNYSRRNFLREAGLGTAALALSACSGGGEKHKSAPQESSTIANPEKPNEIDMYAADFIRHIQDNVNQDFQGGFAKNRVTKDTTKYYKDNALISDGEWLGRREVIVNWPYYPEVTPNLLSWASYSLGYEQYFNECLFYQSCNGQVDFKKLQNSHPEMRKNIKGSQFLPEKIEQVMRTIFKIPDYAKFIPNYSPPPSPFSITTNGHEVQIGLAANGDKNEEETWPVFKGMSSQGKDYFLRVTPDGIFVISTADYGACNLRPGPN